MNRVGWVAVLALGVVFSARADVWQDCRAWYSGLGGKCAPGQLKTGTALDLRHAADASASTHGGTVKCNVKTASNVVQTVFCPTSGQTLENQCTTYFAQPEKIDTDGRYKINEGGFQLPVAVETNLYTVLLRVRLDKTQPTNVTEHGFLDMGYNYANGQSFNLRLTDKNELQVCYAKALKKPLTATNDVTKTLFGAWLEVAVQMSNGTVRVGAMVPGAEKMSWLSFWGNFANEVVQMPKDGMFYLGGITHYGGLSGSANAARAAFHMVAYWDRVLSEREITEAFSWPKSMAVLRVGGEGYGAEMFAGRAAEEVTDVSACLESPQEQSAFPSALGSGQALRIGFEVPVTVTNLAQVLRIAGSAGSAAGAVDCQLDGLPLGTVGVEPGKVDDVLVDGEMLTEGSHELLVRRTDSGTGDLKLDLIELSGSWCLGYRDDGDAEMGGDRYAYAGAKPFELTDLTTNRWKMVQSCSTKTRYLEIIADVNAKDAAERRFTFRSQSISAPMNQFDLVVSVNGEETHRVLWDRNVGYPFIKFSLAPGELRAGRNVIRIKSEDSAAFPAPGQSWMHYDYYSLEVGRRPSGLLILVR